MSIEREIRQVTLGRQIIDSYDGSLRSLGSVVNGMRSILDEFELASPEWIETYRGHWWTLEQVYAVALDEGAPNVPLDAVSAIDESLSSIGFMLDESAERLRRGE